MKLIRERGYEISSNSKASKEKYKNKKSKTYGKYMVEINSKRSVLMLNVNGLNASLKRLLRLKKIKYMFFTREI